MSIYRLETLFAPRSVALVGASPRAGSLGHTVLHNLRAGGFSGALHLVNPRHVEVEGIRTLASVEAVEGSFDVAVIATPAQSVPQIVAAAADKGAAAAIVITAGLGHGAGSLAQAAEQAAREKGLRIVGPNCLGVMVPSARFNASFATRMPRQGDLAVIYIDEADADEL